MLKASIRDDNPVLFTESIALYPKPGPMPDDGDTDYLIPIGKGDIKREGAHVTLVAYARGVDWALQAARLLAKDGVEAEVVDLRWLRPLDMDLVYTSFKEDQSLCHRRRIAAHVQFRQRDRRAHSGKYV